MLLNKLPPGVCWRGEGGRRGATGLLNKGGGSNRLPGLVAKQQAVEFPQVQTSLHNNVFAHGTVTNEDDKRGQCVTIKGLGQLDQINTYQHL